jgi:hypothetical protein
MWKLNFNKRFAASNSTNPLFFNMLATNKNTNHVVSHFN